MAWSVLSGFVATVASVASDSVTLIDAGLAVTLLVGLVLNAALGWLWADPLAALGLAALAVKEGIEAVRNE